MNREKAIEMLDNVYEDYLMKNINRQSLEKKLSIILSELFDNPPKKFEVSVAGANLDESFYGMRVFPVVNKLCEITSDITTEKLSFKEVYNRWKNITDWYIEIDSECFDRTINFNPKELTALTLHEIGHTVNSDKVVERFYRAYKESYMRMNVADKASLKFLYILYTIPFAVACSTRSWNLRKEEFNADKLVLDYGYGEHLASALGKIIKQHGDIVNQCNDNTANSTISTSVRWCNLNIGDLVKRKNTLKDSLHYQVVRANSGYMKVLSMHILDFLGIKLRENYSGNAVESITYDILSEKDFHKNYTLVYDTKKLASLENAIRSSIDSAYIALESKKPPKLPSAYDIDEISVEVDRISNHHDRIYVLDLIYEKYEQLNDFSEYMDLNPEYKRKYETQVNQMKEALDQMRKAVLEKRKFNNDYKLFVKYPEGYEG